MIEKLFFVYILASRPGGAIYIGVTSDLMKRVYQHINGITKGHTAEYNIKRLVYYEIYSSAEEAILREKRLKKWTRAMKNDLIGRHNPLWEDWYPKLTVDVIPAKAGISVAAIENVDGEIPACAGMTKDRKQETA